MQNRPKKNTGKKYDKPEKPGPIRLNKHIANAGICSRREADTLIQEGKIKVNGKYVTELGSLVNPGDKVEYKGKVLKAEKLQYVLLNKPKDFITTTKDERNRKTVMNLVEKACTERIFPVGRLDRLTTGLLLFTNDGELAKRLTHPSFQIKKIYRVDLDSPITQEHFEAIKAGIKLEDGIATVNDLAILDDDYRCLGIEIHIGRNRIVRRIFEHFGYKVMKLDRVMFGPLTKKDLSRGKWRHLSAQEILHLRGNR
ncbi:MAG: rRNA pseudouridine synthase [Cyclobacteriaceae bacterium]|nr:rRNA pseudouridine synthase [Cyclobacteriaceae bacterium]